MRRPAVGDILFFALALSAVTVTALLLRREFFQPDPHDRADQVIANWRSIAAVGSSVGPADARAVMVVFLDFQCPFCRTFATITDSLHMEHPELRIVERHMPLTSIHPQALNAAYAAECAGLSGKYWPMRTTLFTRPGLVEEESWGLLAERAGVADTAAVVTCVRTRAVRARIDADIAAAQTVEATGTPTVILNAVKFGVPPVGERLRSAITKALSNGGGT